MILQSPHDVLRSVARPVDMAMIRDGSLQELFKAMRDALEGEDDGVAIAAPQVGSSLRIFMVSKRASKKFAEKQDDELIFINPEIIRLGKQKEELSEGCLSVRWKYGIVKRAKTATVRALNIDGNEFVMTARGLLAQIFQHEVDHLEGVLFIDKAKNIEDIPPVRHA